MEPTTKPWRVYLVRCKDGSIYTGITDDVDARIKKHNSGKGAKYTAQRRPDQGKARQREVQLKGWTRQKKEELIAGFPRLHSG